MSLIFFLLFNFIITESFFLRPFQVEIQINKKKKERKSMQFCSHVDKAYSFSAWLAMIDDTALTTLTIWY